MRKNHRKDCLLFYFLGPFILEAYRCLKKCTVANLKTSFSTTSEREIAQSNVHFILVPLLLFSKHTRFSCVITLVERFAREEVVTSLGWQYPFGMKAWL
jgi:hypothetical protein